MDNNTEITEFLDFLGDAILIADRSSRIIFVNRSCAKLFGYSKYDMHNLTLDKLMQGCDVQGHEQKVSSFIDRHSKPRAMMARNVMPCVDANGRAFSAKISIANIVFDGNSCAIATIHDYSTVQNLINDLQSEANTDALTGLFNKRHLESLLDKEYVLINGSPYLGVANLDLNGFKAINDTYGHDVGDSLLLEISRRLKVNLRNTDISFRMGGDEFLVLFVINDPDKLDQEVRGVGIKLQALVTKPIYIDSIKDEVRVGVSIGLGSLPTDGEDLANLIKKTDQAMYQCKAQRTDYVLVSQTHYSGV
jgi:diguanylate cyclase (GGDEF)-like protein/PAS domain S-box-containing protein